MDVVLITLGVLGLGAIVVSAYVFMVAARNYVSEETAGSGRINGSEPVTRSEKDRRQGQAVSFPLMVNGILIQQDRRSHRDRRSQAIA